MQSCRRAVFTGEPLPLASLVTQDSHPQTSIELLSLPTLQSTPIQQLQFDVELLDVYRAAILQVQQHMYHHPSLTLAGLQHLLLECQVIKTQPCQWQQHAYLHAAMIHIGMYSTWHTQHTVDHHFFESDKAMPVSVPPSLHVMPSTLHATFNTLLAIAVRHLLEIRCRVAFGLSM